jgi:hypothetical protein
MHGGSASDPYLTADLIGFTAGLAVSLLLLALAIRAARIPGTPAANILLAACAVLWNSGGLAHGMVVAFGIPKEARAALLASAMQFTGPALWAVAMLAIWRPLAVKPWQQLAWRALRGQPWPRRPPRRFLYGRRRRSALRCLRTTS